MEIHNANKKFIISNTINPQSQQTDTIEIGNLQNVFFLINTEPTRVISAANKLVQPVRSHTHTHTHTHKRWKQKINKISITQIICSKINYKNNSKIIEQQLKVRRKESAVGKDDR